MPIQITMPRLSDTMQEGTLIKWRVKVGDQVKSGDLLADVETDKATMELQSFDDGTVAALVAGEGQTVAVGKPILVLAEAGENVEQAAGSVSSAGPSTQGETKAPAAPQAPPAPPPASDAQPSQPAPAAKQQQQQLQQPAAAGSQTAPQAAQPIQPQAPAASPAPVSQTQTAVTEAPAPGRIRVSPLARRIAEERGVDLARIKGTGPDGRIIKRDIESAPAGSPTPSAAPPTPGLTPDAARLSGPRQAAPTPQAPAPTPATPTPPLQGAPSR